MFRTEKDRPTGIRHRSAVGAAVLPGMYMPSAFGVAALTPVWSMNWPQTTSRGTTGGGGGGGSG